MRILRTIINLMPICVMILLIVSHVNGIQVFAIVLNEIDFYSLLSWSSLTNTVVDLDKLHIDFTDLGVHSGRSWSADRPKYIAIFSKSLLILFTLLGSSLHSPRGFRLSAIKRLRNLVKRTKSRTKFPRAHTHIHTQQNAT